MLSDTDANVAAFALNLHGRWLLRDRVKGDLQTTSESFQAFRDSPV